MICSLLCEGFSIPGHLMCSKFEEVHAIWGMQYKILTCVKSASLEHAHSRYERNMQ